jgi:hypothetical protein
MADTFAVDPQEARRTAGELTAIRSALSGVGSLVAGAEATGSDRVRRALERFGENSTESRRNVGDLLERAASLLSGLAEGSTAVDRALHDALEPTSPTPSGPPSTSPTPSAPVPAVAS